MDSSLGAAGYLLKQAGVSKRMAIQLLVDWTNNQMGSELFPKKSVEEYARRGYNPHYKGCKGAETIDFGGENFCVYAGTKESHWM